MARARTLTLNTKVEVTGADKLNNLGKRLQRTGAQLSLFVTTPLLALGGVATQAASDLNESMNAVNVTFGKTADAINKIGETSADSFGLSQRAFNEVATRFSAFATTVAGEGGDVAGVIEDLTRRGADFASVYNLEVADALTLFQSGLAGETEPLRRFGIDLSAAAVQAHALATGISDGVGPLTEAEKVQARYSLLLEQTSKVQGDFARTSGEAANQQRTMAARAENAAAVLGRKFLPIKQKVIEALSAAIDAWSGLSEPMQNAVLLFAGAAAALGPLLGVIGTFMRAATGLVKIAGALRVALLHIPTALGFVDLALAKTTAAFTRFRFAAVGAVGAVALVAAEFGDDIADVGVQIGKSLDLPRLPQGLRDFLEISLDPTSEEFLRFGETVEEELASVSVTADREFQAFTDITHQHLLAAKGIVDEGVTAMADELGGMPEKAADELLANQFHLTNAIDELINFMDQALTPAEEVFNARMFLASQAAADGLASGNPLVVQKTQELIDAANAVLAQHGLAAFNYGYNFGAAYAAGIINARGLVADAGRQLGGALANQVRIESEPPDHRSPLYGITKWGANLVKTYAEGIRRAMPSLQGASALMAGAVVAPSFGAMSPVPVAGGGGLTVVNNFYLQWDGEPPRGRNEAEIIATLQRLSPLVGGKLGPGYG